ncbi:MAG: hypothetical protein KKC85_18990 [Gammaproteobacteria bacterium]|nr:hypothetical protein [Gammaproteobacteria bacterium]
MEREQVVQQLPHVVPLGLWSKERFAQGALGAKPGCKRGFRREALHQGRFRQALERMA